MTEIGCSRRFSSESILSLQGKETVEYANYICCQFNYRTLAVIRKKEFTNCKECGTRKFQLKNQDVVHDTSDSDSRDDGEWEPVDLEDELAFTDTDSSGFTDAEIISTKVIEVSVADDGDLQLADSELTAGSGSDLDSELDLLDFWKCARCEAANNNPLYRYCETCFKVRKNFFPPRPKRKSRLDNLKVPRTLSQDSGVESQELSQQGPGPSVVTPRSHSKRRAETPDQSNKRLKKQITSSDSESDSDCDRNRNLVSNTSVPNPKVEKSDIDSVIPNSKDKVVDGLPNSKEKGDDGLPNLKEKDDNLCIMCCVEPKSGVFVHGRIAHICCCYKCALKVWAKSKRCPVCNCKVSNVLKAVVG